MPRTVDAQVCEQHLEEVYDWNTMVGLMLVQSIQTPHMPNMSCIKTLTVFCIKPFCIKQSQTQREGETGGRGRGERETQIVSHTPSPVGSWVHHAG
jgi:hypothetical protein